MDIFEILSIAQIDSEKKTISFEKDLGSDYAKLKALLPTIGGKWNSRTSKHEFSYDPTEIIDSILENRILPPKNPLAFFPTRPDISEELVEELVRAMGSFAELNFLEPSSGILSIVKPLWERFSDREIFPANNLNIHAIELDEFRYQVCKAANLDCVTVFNENFLTFDAGVKYNGIVMNSPFSGDGGDYLQHIYHAWELLKEEGVLVSIVPLGWLINTHDKYRKFREFVYTNGWYYNLPDDAFKDAGAGTLTKTAAIVLQKSNWNELHKIPVGQYKNEWLREIELTLSSDVEYDKFKNKTFKELRDYDFSLGLPEETKNWLRNYYWKIIKLHRESAEHIFIKEDEDFAYLYQDFLDSKFDYV